MQLVFGNVSWLAIVVSTVLAFLLGWLWYSPKLFGEKWAAGVGVQLGNAQAPPPAAMITQLCGTFLLAWLVAVCASVSLALVDLALAAIVLLVIANGLFAQKSRYAIATEAGFIVAMVVLMLAVQLVLG